ncbi:MAG: glycine zipper 2TM domain-containing protein, partial [Sulfuricella sp.]
MSEPTSKTSPFIIAASIAVIIASIVGVGAMTGLIPGRGSKPEVPGVTATSQTAGMAASPTQPTTGTEAKTIVADKAVPVQPEPAAKRAVKTTHYKPAAKATSAQRTEMSEKKAPVNVCYNCGVITAIRTVEQAGEGSGLGVIAGGVVGGLLGHQVGGGTGKDLATIAGAIGGGYAGQQIEKRVKTTKHYEITVRMDDGSHRTMVQETEPAFGIGEQV